MTIENAIDLVTIIGLLVFALIGLRREREWEAKDKKVFEEMYKKRTKAYRYK